MDSLASRAKARRKELKLNQADVAKTAGLKQSDISKIESGQIRETTKLLGLAKALKCAPDWLESGKGDMLDGLGASSAITPRHSEMTNSWGNPEWPFDRVTVAQYKLLRPEEKNHLEDGILLTIKAREPPSKQQPPAPTSAAA